MFLIPLILTAGLDLSLPEFQPELDASGNYIVAQYDDVSGAFEVEEVRELPDGLTVAALAQNEESDSEGEVIYNRDGTVIVNSSTLSNVQFNWNSNQIVNGSSSARYIPLSGGYTYDIFSSGTGNYYIGYSLNVPIDLTSLGNGNMTYYCPIDCYLFTVKGSSTFYVSYNANETPSDPSGNDPEDPSGNDPSGNDPTPDNPSIDVSGVVSELQSIHEELSMKLRIIIFVLIWQFIMPLAMKIRDHIFNLKHD